MRGPVPSTRALLIMQGFVVALVVAVFILVISTVMHFADDNARQDTKISRLNNNAVAQQKALNEANSKLVALGEAPVPAPVSAPTTTTGKTGATGAQGPGPSTAQIQAAVAVVCGTTECRGPAGRTGNTGAPGASTTGEAGPAGTDGKDGKDGKDSNVPGPPGPAGEDGADAYPFTFTFVVPGTLGDTTYSCTVTSPDSQASCVTT